MPRVESDPKLQSMIRALIEKEGGTAAAKLIGINRTALWRIARTGNALPKTKVIIKERISTAALIRKNKQNETDTINSPTGTFTLEDLRKLRQYLSFFLEMVNTFEKELTDTDINVDNNVSLDRVKIQDVRHANS